MSQLVHQTKGSLKGIQKRKSKRLESQELKGPTDDELSVTTGSTSAVSSHSRRRKKRSIVQCTNNSRPERTPMRMTILKLQKARILRDKEDGQEIHTKTGGSKASLIPRRYLCRTCDYSTDHKKTMQTHGKMHRVVKNFKCNFCPFWSNYLGVVGNHEKLYHPWDTFTPAATLKQVETEPTESSSTHGSGQTPQLIPETETSALRCSESKSDGKVKTRPSMVFNCKICDFQTNFDSGIRAHKKMHSVVKRFKCELCPFWSDFRTVTTNHELACHLSVTSQCRKSKAIPLVDLIIDSSEANEQASTLPKDVAQNPAPNFVHQTSQELTSDPRMKAAARVTESPSKFINYRICSLCGTVLTDSEVVPHMKGHYPTTSEESVGFASQNKSETQKFPQLKQARVVLEELGTSRAFKSANDQIAEGNKASLQAVRQILHDSDATIWESDEFKDEEEEPV